MNNIVSNPNKQRTELEKKRRQYLKVLTFVFEKSFPVVFNGKRLNGANKG